MAAALLDGLFLTDMAHLILAKFAREHLHYSALPYYIMLRVSYEIPRKGGLKPHPSLIPYVLYLAGLE